MQVGRAESSLSLPEWLKVRVGLLFVFSDTVRLSTVKVALCLLECGFSPLSCHTLYLLKASTHPLLHGAFNSLWTNPHLQKPAKSSTHPPLRGAFPSTLHLGPGLTSGPSAARLGRRAMRTFQLRGRVP